MSTEARQQLDDHLNAYRVNPPDWRRWVDDIARSAQRQSPNLAAQRLERLQPLDLERLFAAIDDVCFAGLVTRILREECHGLGFRLSSRMISSAGKTSRIARRSRTAPLRFEIAIAPRLLFTTFQWDTAALVCGRECRSAYEALQRVMEHEAIHLLEMVHWQQSSCRASRFRTIAARFFGHQASDHRLWTPSRVAAERYSIRQGDAVRFDCRGRVLRGIVNRVQQRATVLVPDPAGERYSDGGRYRKFYVPLSQLQREA